jgi:hypothetical protein
MMDVAPAADWLMSLVFMHVVDCLKPLCRAWVVYMTVYDMRVMANKSRARGHNQELMLGWKASESVKLEARRIWGNQSGGDGDG